MSHDDFDIETIYNKIQGLKNKKAKLSLRTFTNDNFYQIKDCSNAKSMKDLLDQEDDIDLT